MGASRLSWYWHRLRAMEPRELAAHCRKRLAQIVDERWGPDWKRATCGEGGRFPRLPPPAEAPEGLRLALRDSRDRILAGEIRAFGDVALRVDRPPIWQKEYLAGRDFTTARSAFRLNHRELPGRSDIKLIWEPSRWHSLVRLAQAAYVLSDVEAGRVCRQWLADWVEKNPPGLGWNWTSALETGIRLIQFAWIDALLAAANGDGTPDRERHATEMDALRDRIVPPHVRFTWRYRSFGSSANNHLLGELCGLILAAVRWPESAQWGASLDRLQRLWEQEVLTQFAPDGGNREQALNYHLFSWEFCLQTWSALRAAGRTASEEVVRRLQEAVGFFVTMQAAGDVWDYGDSDDASVTPFMVDEARSAGEWRDWMVSPESSPAIEYWLGEWRRSGAPCEPRPPAGEAAWKVYPDTGQAARREGRWMLRWDLSPLGYLATAAHGHLDALHLSLWLGERAVVVDPGTGVYYGNKPLRNWLASREAHNGPCPIGLDYPARRGPFLWAEHHPAPEWSLREDGEMTATLVLPTGQVKRAVSRDIGRDGWVVRDEYEPSGAVEVGFGVYWQFAPGVEVRREGDRRFIIEWKDTTLIVEAGPDWSSVEWVSASEGAREVDPPPGRGVVSPGYQQIAAAPGLWLRAERHKPCVFTTAFLASPRE